MGLLSVWNALQDQLYLGDAEFADKSRHTLSNRLLNDSEIPRLQRYSKGLRCLAPRFASAPLSMGEIAQRIHLIRGQRVVLDTDLAAFYGETTKRFNQQVRRNLARFPADFMLQLDVKEAKSLRLQFATLDATGSDGKPGRGRYSKYLPMAFTQSTESLKSDVLHPDIEACKEPC